MYLPWWSTALLVVLGVFLFRNFYEAIWAGILIDLLYGTRTVEFAGVWFVFTVSFSALVLIGERLKKNIRAYDAKY